MAVGHRVPGVQRELIDQGLALLQFQETLGGVSSGGETGEDDLAVILPGRLDDRAGLSVDRDGRHPGLGEGEHVLLLPRLCADELVGPLPHRVRFVDLLFVRRPHSEPVEVVLVGLCPRVLDDRLRALGLEPGEDLEGLRGRISLPGNRGLTHCGPEVSATRDRPGAGCSVLRPTRERRTIRTTGSVSVVGRGLAYC
ncbi:hypothetical protein [Nocardiopsis metallicus]|uniref:hypothetical protein n=1 Tax=Nocardiopsis metallicus TaxID=179819 RepID=UPI00160EBFF8|nr:hypothetical protein [Nocardiopsis metallicus]